MLEGLGRARLMHTVPQTDGHVAQAALSTDRSKRQRQRTDR